MKGNKSMEDPGAMGRVERETNPEELESRKLKELYRNEVKSIEGQYPGINVVELEDGMVDFDASQVSGPVDGVDTDEARTRLNRWRAALRARKEDV